MNYISQKYLHDPDNGQIGDCFRACIASILDLERDEVPHFARDHGTDYLRQLNLWLVPFDLYFMEMCVPDGYEKIITDMPAYTIVTGDSPRFKDCKHCVVAFKGEIVHDPHPDKKGLLGRIANWQFGMFIHRFTQEPEHVL